MIADHATLPLLEDVLRCSPELGAEIELLATDVDGTLTTEGKLHAEIGSAIAALVAAGVRVLPVSGRSAGEVLGLCRYLPGVDCGLAENGFVAVAPDRPSRLLVTSVDRAHLRAVAREIEAELGGALVEAPDGPFRLVDVAFERGDRDEQELERMRALTFERGVHLVWSSVHVHFAPALPDKGAAVMEHASALGIAPGRIVTIGDAPNDAGLFVEGRFGLTVGTADVVRQRAYFPHLPVAVTRAREAGGFLELARALVDARSRRG